MATIADLPIDSRYRVYDIVLGQYIYSYLFPDEPGDIPPDVAILPVLGLRAVDNVLYIDTTTKGV